MNSIYWGADGEFTDNKWGKTLRKSAIAPKQDEAAKYLENMEKAQELLAKII